MIRHLLLDLDNTLYPSSTAMNEGITRRMLEFVARYLRVSFEEGVALRAARLPSYGTTLEWLKSEHGLADEDVYFAAVHPESEVDALRSDPALRSYLLSLGLPMTLLTNSPIEHAERVLRFFNITDIFTGIYDIKFMKGQGKPHPSSFLQTLAACGYSLGESLFVDDHPKYVRGYQAIGGKAVIVDESGKYAEMAQTEGFGHIGSIYELADLLSKDRDPARRNASANS